jgi:valyl-tRNA synthetase
MSTEISAKYDPAASEDKWYQYWLDNGYFTSIPDSRPAYTIVIPPPNVTGVLHMGHMLNNTIQDVLSRRARMLGFNTCWVPGTDHASIATEAKVVRKLRDEGIKKSSLSREEFLKHAWNWTDKHGGIILEQLKKLGAGCDWNRTRFTMDDQYYRSVIDCFIDLYKKGLIYRGERMINWDPAAKTALSDEEVIYKEVSSKLYFVRYVLSDEPGTYITIATTRPETILGDTAVCIHPEDERYSAFHGRKVIVPLIGREIPIICDEYVDREFGTGCLKVTPCHDPNDYDLGKKHNLSFINMMNPDGTLSEAAGLYIGFDRFEARTKIVADLERAGLLAKVEEHPNKVGFSERTDVVVEPRPSLQWWVDMKKLAKPALDAVNSGEVAFHPEKFVNTYRYWMENIKDWCISRQLWWGHRIPAWYYGEGNDNFVVASDSKEALELARVQSGNSALNDADLRQDEDVMDTWFSSWLWPISVFDGFYKEDEVSYYYPTSDLVTGPDILFFWVARMIMAGYEYRGKKPFSNVYFTGIVRDKLGRKMSKSLGNSPDPLELISEYGADGVRAGLLLTAPAGNDIPFDPKLCEQGRNFSNKIWNAFRLINGWEAVEIPQRQAAVVAVQWMRSRLSEAVLEINESFRRFRISEALMTTYKLIWDDFCSWYLEMVKPPYGEQIDVTTKEACKAIFGDLLKLLHPFMPFISEEIWQKLDDRTPDQALVVASWPKGEDLNQVLLDEFCIAADVVTGIRAIRKDKQIPNKEPLRLFARRLATPARAFDPVVAHLTNLSGIEDVDSKVDSAFSFIVGTDEYYIPFGESIDTEAEREKIEKELQYQKGFLASVESKLSNERFVSKAPPAVLEAEQKKKADALSRIRLLEDQLSAL